MKIHTFDDVKICTECFLEHLMSKYTAIRNVTHKQLDNNKVLVNCLIKSRSSLGRRCTPDGLL